MPHPLYVSFPNTWQHHRQHSPRAQPPSQNQCIVLTVNTPSDQLLEAEIVQNHGLTPQEPSRSSQHGAQDLINEYLLNHLLFSSSLFLSFNYLDNKSTKALQGGNPQILCVRPIAGTCVVFSWQWEQRLQGIHFIFHHEEEEIAHCGTKWVWVRILTLWFRICVMLHKSLNLFDSGLSSVKPRLWRTVGEI